MTASLLLTACVGGGSSNEGGTEADSLRTHPSEGLEVLLVDTVCGFIGDGTSMNVIELVNTDATDTTFMDVSDDSSIKATLEVGNEVRAIVCHESDGSISLLSITDIK